MKTIKWMILAGLVPMLAGCISQRTVTTGGRVTEKKIVITRPVKDLINNSR